MSTSQTNLELISRQSPEGNQTNMPAIDAQALTLADYAKFSNSPVVEKFTTSLYETHSVLKDIPLKTNPSLKAAGMRLEGGGLPSVNWARINQEPVTTKATFTDYEEEVFLIRNKFQIDRKLLAQKNWIQDPVKAQFDAYLQSVAYDTNDKFINNDPATGDPDAWVGLKTRIDNADLYGVAPGMKINGGSVDLTPLGGSKASALQFLVLIERMLGQMNSIDGKGVVLYMALETKIMFANALRMAGDGAGFSSANDAFDRKVDMFRQIKIRDIGVLSDEVTPVIRTTEKADGTNGAPSGGPQYTSIYGVHYGEGYFSGWQTNELKPENLGISRENGVMYNIVVDWGAGFWIPNKRSICRVYNIRIA